jgi:hypothetical protein
MDNETAKEIFEHLFSLLEDLETRSTATLQLLRAKGIATEEELATHLDQAGNASSVRWRAARARINHLLSPVKPAEKPDENPAAKPEARKPAASAESAKDENGKEKNQLQTEKRTAQEQKMGSQPASDDRDSKQEGGKISKGKEPANPERRTEDKTGASSKQGTEEKQETPKTAGGAGR